jgi:hypothetical protein
MPVLAASALARADTIIPFTSEHAVRGVIYNMTLGPPLTNPMDGFGMAIADLDGDDRLDLALLGRADGLVGIYQNLGAGMFANRSATSGIATTPWGCGISAFDYDRDGDLDLYIVQRTHPCRLWRNDGGFSFTDVTEQAGVGLSVFGAGCSVADFDGDGWLDLHVCIYSAAQRNRLFRNLGNGTFEDVAPVRGVDSTGLSYQSVWSDVDGDRWPDLCVSNDRGFGNVPNQLHRNVAGTFTDVSASSGMDVSLCSMGVACGDVDGTLRPDFYFTNLPDPAPPLEGVNPLLLNTGAGTFVRAESPWGVAHLRMSWAAIFWDFDNDGRLDLYVNSETLPNSLYRNMGLPPMIDIAAAAGVTGTTALSYVSAIGDLDGDGDLDLVQNNYGGAVRLYMNQDGSRRSWLRLRVAADGRVRDAVGASVTIRPVGPGGQPLPAQWREVHCGGNGYLGQNEMTLHFGLGTAVSVPSADVLWPGHGPARRLSHVPVNGAWTVYPPSRLGDADGNGARTAADWSAFVAHGMGPLRPGWEMFDFDGNWQIDSTDIAAFWSSANAVRGDISGDAIVDGVDLGMLLAAWGSTGHGADLDLSGAVDGADLSFLLANWTP